MAQQIGELFVSLGVKGTDKTVAAFTSIKGGLSEVASMSLETKAAIVGAMYAVEQMTAAAGGNAQGLVNLNNTLGISIDTLQRYRYAASLAGVSNETMDASFQSIQKTMAQYRATGQAPMALARIATATGGLDYQRIANQDWAYLFQKYNQFAQSNVAQDQKMLALSELGQSGVAPAMMGNKFTAQNLARAPVTSEGSIRALEKMKERFTDIEAHFGRMNNNLVLKWGPELAKDLDKIIPKLEKLINSFLQLGEALQTMKWVGKFFDGLALSMDVISNTLGTLHGDKKSDSFMRKFVEGLVGAAPAGVPVQATPSQMSVFLHQTFGDAHPSTVKKAAHDGITSAHKKSLTKSTNHFTKTNPGLNQP